MDLKNLKIGASFLVEALSRKPATDTQPDQVEEVKFSTYKLGNSAISTAEDELVELLNKIKPKKPNFSGLPKGWKYLGKNTNQPLIQNGKKTLGTIWFYGILNKYITKPGAIGRDSGGALVGYCPEHKSAYFFNPGRLKSWK